MSESETDLSVAIFGDSVCLAERLYIELEHSFQNMLHGLKYRGISINMMLLIKNLVCRGCQIYSFLGRILVGELLALCHSCSVVTTVSKWGHKIKSKGCSKVVCQVRPNITIRILV